MARQLVRRYPRDPRSYGILSGVLGNSWQFEAAEAVWQTALSLDCSMVADRAHVPA
jgi:hypothetical protein